MSLKSSTKPSKNKGAVSQSAHIKRLYEHPLPSSRSGKLYNAFSYPTKISPEAIALFIATHTDPGDQVLDTFAGSGTTGLAALLCDKPPESLKKMAANLGVNPTWGPRRAILYELGVLGAFISETLCKPPDPDEFARAAQKLIDMAQNSLGWIYQTKDPNGAIGEIRHVIWSDVLICPVCEKESLYSEVAVKREPLCFTDQFVCKHCGKQSKLDDIERASERKFDPLTNLWRDTKKRVPAIVYGRTKKVTWQRRSSEDDLAIFEAIDQAPLPKCVPVSKMQWGDLKRNGYHQGISHVHHFYTPRNLLAIGSLWELIGEFEPKMQNALRLLVLSYNSSHSTLMTRVVAKKNQSDFVLTGAQTGILYISSLPVEKNVFEGLRRKAKTLYGAFKLVHGSKSEVQVFNKSSTNLTLSDNVIDYVFTDPPFTDYIPYAELNQINEAWLGTITDRREEIIVSRAQGKDLSTYAGLMGCVFSEIHRVLKDHGTATIVFHSAKASVWRALAEAFNSAGLAVKATSILDKMQDSFKQVVSNVSVKGDPLLLLEKDHQQSVGKRVSTRNAQQIISNLLEKISDEHETSRERTAERLYSRYISDCLAEGLSVEINAATFYDQVREANGIR